MSEIGKVHAREVLDSRGHPTVEVEVTLRGGAFGRATVPSGASTGGGEAVELRDADPKRYGGRGVGKAVEHVNTLIAGRIVGLEASHQSLIDQTLRQLDGTPTKERLGANAILGVSLAVAKAAAAERHLPLYKYIAQLYIHTSPHGGAPTGWQLPVPLMNIVNGGRHADNRLDFQEFMIVPVGAKSFTEALRIGVEVYHSLRRVLKRRGHHTAIGDEGGFAPDLASNEEAVEVILEAIGGAGYTSGRDVYLALDPAASEFSEGGRYRLKTETDGKKQFTREEMVALYTRWVDQYPIVSIEDGMAEDDWEGWDLLTAAIGERVQLVGDDLFVTNRELLRKGIAHGIANAILIKMNQIGTLTETLEAIAVAKAAGYATIVSHRSGETEDTTLADLAVGVGAGQVKTGAPSRAERTAKYNQLLRIEEDLGAEARFPGRAAFRPLRDR